jgi:uncharacterized membrane protein
MTSSPNRPRIAVLALGGIGLAYPFLIYAALGRVPAGALVLVALALIGARLGMTRGIVARSLAPTMFAVLVVTAALAFVEATLAALAYPVLMSLGMAAAFGLSLRGGPTLVEIFSSLTHPDPTPAAKAYMRKVTLVWCVFLLGNAAVSALTVASGDMVLWTLYNGLISYVLMGVLFAGEYLVRRRVRARGKAA